MSNDNTKDEKNQTDKYHSLPNIRSDDAKIEEDRKKLYSMSLSQIRKHSSEFSDYHHKPSPFSLRWISGFNPKAGVLNLNVRGSTTVFYAASNCGILYNWTTNQMRILQGHRHMVNCISADGDGKWLVTSDSGPENLITIWDSEDYFPSKTYFLPHGNMRVAKVAMSTDARFLLTIGYDDKTAIFWWIWSSGMEEPHAALNVDIPKDGVLAMDFNPDNTWQFVLMSKTDIWIGVSQKVFVMERGLLKETADYELKIKKIEKKPEIMAFGKLTCFTFVCHTAQVLVGTHRGAIHVNAYTMEYQENMEPKTYDQMKFVKAFKLEDSRINDIKSIDGVIVTGNNAGQIHFYDEQMKLLHWVQGFTVDRVRSLSFNVSPRSYRIYDPKCKKPKKCLCWEKVATEIDPVTGTIRQKLVKQDLPKDATTSGKTFLVRDFIICTGNQGIGFVDFVTEKLVTIMDYKISPALSLTVHPEKPYLCRGFVDGMVDLVNFTQHKLLKRLDLRVFYKVVVPPDENSIKYDYEIQIPELSVTCLKYSPSGLHLACGLNTGQLLFLDPVTIKILTDPPFKDSQHAIKDIAYSSDSLTLAFSDAGHTVCVYKYNCATLAWSFVGKHRAHYKDINAVFFTEEQNPDGEYKLLSLGADRIMVEYNIGASSGEHLEIFSLDRVEQTAVPLAGFHWPTPKDLDPEESRTDLPLILVATDEVDLQLQYKYKIVNYATAMTLATVLGPRYESPVYKMKLVSRREDPNSEDQNRRTELQYILFATKNVIGLQKLPLDGNPWKHVGVLGHPIQITNLSYREDLGVLFTQGAKDTCTCQWAANYRSVDSTSEQGGGALDPYYCLIENGRPGWLFGEIRDLFYYIQILCQGTFSPTRRSVKDYIPIESLPDLMRALGFFPSEYEVETLLTEAKFKVYQRNPSTEVDFEEFVKLYLNHRPAFGDDLARVRNAFRTFASHDRESYVMSREDFVEMLGSYGECFSRELSWYLLSILSGQSFEDRANMTEGDFSFLPEIISLGNLLRHIMGIQDVDISADQFSTIDSMGSSYGSSVTSEEKEKNN